MNALKQWQDSQLFSVLSTHLAILSQFFHQALFQLDIFTHLIQELRINFNLSFHVHLGVSIFRQFPKFARRQEVAS
jgi:predicted DNA-binding protein (UPF0278 family)